MGRNPDRWLPPPCVVLTPAPLRAPEPPLHTPPTRIRLSPYLFSKACVPSSSLTLGHQGGSDQPLVWKVPEGPSRWGEEGRVRASPLHALPPEQVMLCSAPAPPLGKNGAPQGALQTQGDQVMEGKGGSSDLGVAEGFGGPSRVWKQERPERQANLPAMGTQLNVCHPLWGLGRRLLLFSTPNPPPSRGQAHLVARGVQVAPHPFPGEPTSSSSDEPSSAVPIG